MREDGRRESRIIYRTGASESTALRVCNRRDCDGTSYSSLGGERPVSDTLDNRRRGTVGARKKSKKTAGCVVRTTKSAIPWPVACNEDAAHIFLRRTRWS